MKAQWEGKRLGPDDAGRWIGSHVKADCDGRHYRIAGAVVDRDGEVEYMLEDHPRNDADEGYWCVDQEKLRGEFGPVAVGWGEVVPINRLRSTVGAVGPETHSTPSAPYGAESGGVSGAEKTGEPRW